MAIYTIYSKIHRKDGKMVYIIYDKNKEKLIRHLVYGGNVNGVSVRNLRRGTRRKQGNPLS